MKAPVEIEQFRKLDLRVGTVTAVRHHPSIGDLLILTVGLDELVEVLAPAALAAGLALGSRVIVASGLHPLSVPGARFTRCLAASPRVAAPIPDGSRLS